MKITSVYCVWISWVWDHMSVCVESILCTDISPKHRIRVQQSKMRFFKTGFKMFCVFFVSNKHKIICCWLRKTNTSNPMAGYNSIDTPILCEQSFKSHSYGEVFASRFVFVFDCDFSMWCDVRLICLRLCACVRTYGSPTNMNAQPKT